MGVGGQGFALATCEQLYRCVDSNRRLQYTSSIVRVRVHTMILDVALMFKIVRSKSQGPPAQNSFGECKQRIEQDWRTTSMSYSKMPLAFKAPRALNCRQLQEVAPNGLWNSGTEFKACSGLLLLGSVQG